MTDLGRLLRENLDMDLCILLTHGVHIFELVAPILLLLPLGNGRIRRWIAGSLIAFHISIFLLIDVAHYSPVMIALLLVYMGQPISDPPAMENTFGRRRTVNAVLFSLSMWMCIVPALQSNAVTNSFMRRSGLGTDPVTRSLSQFFAWEQDWAMFSPSVPRLEYLVVIRGRTQSGRRVDPYTEKEPHSGYFRDYPSYLYWSYSQKFIGSTGIQKAEALRRWAMGRWNRRYEDQMVSAEVVLLQQIMRRPDEGKTSTLTEGRLAGP